MEKDKKSLKAKIAKRANKVLTLYQNRRGYCYNSDTLFLYDFATSFLKENSSLIDIGSGCGILGLLCGRDFALSLTQVEIDFNNAFLNQKNSQKNGIDSTIYNCDFLKFRSEEKFDFAISNPPFYRDSTQEGECERKSVARSERNLPFSEMLKNLKRVLKSRGTFIFCYDARESSRIFYELEYSGFRAEVVRFVGPREGMDATLLMCKSRLNSKSQNRILPTLVTHVGREQREWSEEVDKIYKKANTHSIKCDVDSIEIEREDSPKISTTQK